MSQKPKIEPTRDGSTTLYSEAFSQTYHNRAGAVTESRHIFFETPGIPVMLAAHKNLSILEIGFGTGLNLLLLLDYLKKNQSKSEVVFKSIEAFPIDPTIASKLNFGEELEYLDYTPLLKKIFTGLTSGVNRIQINEQVMLEFFVGRFEEIEFDQPVRKSEQKADTPQTTTLNAQLLSPLKGRSLFNYIFHDPFSPDANPEGWTPDLFHKIAAASSPDALLTTYCAASKARAAMAVAGWYVARAPGAPGKREMTMGSLKPEKLEGLKRVNEERLVERFFERENERG